MRRDTVVEHAHIWVRGFCAVHVLDSSSDEEHSSAVRLNEFRVVRDTPEDFVFGRVAATWHIIFVVTAEEVEIVVSEARAFETAALMASDDVFAVFGTLCVAVNGTVGGNLSVEVKASQQSFGSVDTHATVVNGAVLGLELSHDVFEFGSEPVVEFATSFLHRVSAHFGVFVDERSVTEDIDSIEVAESTESAGFELHELSIFAVASVLEEVVTDRDMHVETRVSTVDGSGAGIPRVSVKFSHADIFPNPF